MKTIWFIGICWLTGCWCLGCKDKTSTAIVPVVDLEKAVEKTTLKISEVLDNIRIIRLETRPEVLLPGYFKTWIGNKYILTFSQEEVHLFSSNGKYIRKIAQHGRGPEEFNYIWGYDVDESKDRLYITDSERGVYIIDLKEGRIIGKLPLKEGSPRQLLLSGDTLTYVLKLSKNQNKIGQMKTDGTLLKSIVLPSPSRFSGTCYLGKIKDTIRYKMGMSNRIYVLQDTLKIPWCQFDLSRPYNDESGNGRLIDIVFENKNLLILSLNEMEVKREQNRVNSFTRVIDCYLLPKSDFKPKKISNFYVDIFDANYQKAFPLKIAGKKAYRNLNVSTYKEMLEKKLNNPLVADSLKVLYHDLNEEDNPLILVGNIR